VGENNRSWLYYIRSHINCNYCCFDFKREGQVVQQQTNGGGPGDPYGWDNFFKDAKTGATVVRGLTSARNVIENVYIEQATINNAIRGSTAAVSNPLRTISTVSKVAGIPGIIASWGIAGYQVSQGTDNTSTWVNAGLNTVII